jgi:geranylgeranyl pyrophosphate synthase
LADEIDRILSSLESVWGQSELWPGFAGAMRQALTASPAPQQPLQESRAAWIMLPGLVCQAAGGCPDWADDLTAAWLMFYRAAHLMDAVEDGDRPDNWWAQSRVGVALNAASGLYFTASLFLNRLFDVEQTRPAARAILEDFHTSLLTMCSGQHRDLTEPEPTLEQCWQIAAAKSGVFFGLACRSGARLAIKEAQRCEAFGRFGQAFGVLVQVGDDLEELQALQTGAGAENGAALRRSLAVAYSLEVLQPFEKSCLADALKAAVHDPEAARTAYEQIRASGARLYLTTEIERLRNQALQALEDAGACQPARTSLAQIVSRLVSN